jgi:hypothetical protein
MTFSTCHRLPHLLSLVVAAGLLAGCATDSARPGTVCGHCDYRFSYLTPNPCDPCVPELVLPGYGHTPTSWQVWPETIVHTHVEPGPQALPLENIPPPQIGAPPVPMPPVDDTSHNLPRGGAPLPKAQRALPQLR